MWWIMITVASIVGAVNTLSCEEARMKCAYRVGCGRALQNYAMDCSIVLQGAPPKHCPELCRHSLIALTSTDEGKNLMECECSDEYCEEQKRRVEICRPQVMEEVNKPVLPCRVAQWICAADTMCSTALDYYNQLCRSMFHGKKCTTRCNNSIAILRRQEKAAKLSTCRCDGTEDFDCLTIQKNMERLCFRKHQRIPYGHRNRTESGHHRHKVTTLPPTLPPSVIVVEEPSSSVRVSFHSVLLSLIAFIFVT
ncbi:hypothetical protein WA026_017508 [Henosepilachna vigintioctopunctata]|uniref:GDNF/GAS1 domain-containing protein n=1 Tax=Henosepilachna vigintioctopunctata TaxID=420089 RepID=A0AAW1UTT7_9CUCU